MKTPRSVGKSRNARLNQVGKHMRALTVLFETVKGTPHDTPIMEADFWDKGRELAHIITQCFHEANAHNNDMVPDGTPFEEDHYEVGTTLRDRTDPEGGIPGRQL